MSFLDVERLVKVVARLNRAKLHACISGIGTTGAPGAGVPVKSSTYIGLSTCSGKPGDKMDTQASTAMRISTNVLLPCPARTMLLATTPMEATCASGYTGFNCDVDIDECTVTMPCQNDPSARASTS